MGPAGFEPATSSARGWHPTKLDNGPKGFKVCVCHPYYNLYLWTNSMTQFTVVSQKCLG